MAVVAASFRVVAVGGGLGLSWHYSYYSSANTSTCVAIHYPLSGDNQNRPAV